jgi:hypothetical protein
MSKLSKMAWKKSLTAHLAILLLLTPLVTALAQDTAAKPLGSRPLPMVMDGFCEFTKYQLLDPVTEAPLISRFIEIVVVNGEVDAPFSDGDDRIQTMNLEFNSARNRSIMAMTPGSIEALVTVFVAKTVADDEKVQVWEQMLLRVYNDDDKAKATHYIDTAAHEAQPGFYEMREALSPFGEWLKIKNDTHTKETP